MRFVASARRISALLVVAVLSACGTGDGSQQFSTSISTNDVSFSAASPDAPTPPAQILTATLDPETVYVAVLHNGAAIASVTYSLSGNTAQIVVDPASPGGLGAGVFTGTITVTGYHCADPACSRLVSGNSQVVNVAYQIPPVVRFVAPYVGVAGTADTAVIRGQGFQKFTVEGVTFGASAATTFTVVSDTEIRASYPVLTAGTYPVQIQAPTSPGAITSLANLVVVNAPAYAATTLAYPSAAVLQVQALRYDAERQALLVAVNSGQILRYVFAGGTWGAATPAAVGDLSDIALSTDGQQLLALSQTALTQIDPATLAAGTVTPAPALAADVFLKNLAVANDGNAVVTTGYNGSSNTPTYLYATRSPAFSQPATAPSMDNSTPGGSADGSLIVLAQGSPALASATGVYRYLAASQTFSVTGVSLNQNSVAPALDRAATRIVLNGTNVYDAGYNLLGTLPSTTLAVVVKPDATRAYTFDSTASQVLSFDLTASPAGGAFPQVGSGTAPAGDPGTGVRMAISPDGGTLFLAGNNQIAVQPAPP